jgi:dihydrofolate reductase
MAKLIYASNMSLDGWTEDAQGDLAWAPPDDDVFVAITEIMRSTRTYLYGRRMYETMAVWETDPALAEGSDLRREYADVWSSADKVVYSTTLSDVSTGRTRLERTFDVDAVRALTAAATDDVLVGGPHLAAQAFAAGLVDECHLWVWPTVLGGKNPALAAAARHDLELIDERRIGAAVVHLHYRVR